MRHVRPEVLVSEPNGRSRLTLVVEVNWIDIGRIEGIHIKGTAMDY